MISFYLDTWVRRLQVTILSHIRRRAYDFHPLRCSFREFTGCAKDNLPLDAWTARNRDQLPEQRSADIESQAAQGNIWVAARELEVR